MSRDNEEPKNQTKKKANKLQKIHSEALERFRQTQSSERQNRDVAIEDMRFANADDGQWTEDTIQKRRDRPRYTVNKIAGAIRQIVGDQRQNRTDIKVIPLNKDAKDNIAKLLSGLIRNIEAASKAVNSYDMAFEEAITGGYGGWRVVTGFSDDFEFEQEIKIKPIKSAASSLWFGPAQNFDKSDSEFAFYIADMSADEFKRKHPESSLENFSQEKFSNDLCSSWFRENVVRVAEYWVKEPVTKEIGLMSNGTVLDLKEEKAVIDELAQRGITVLKKRTVKSHNVVMYLMNGVEIIRGPLEWAGRFIPLVPTFGIVTNIEQEELVRGIVRFAKDPSRIYNYATSAAIEATALTPKDPIWLTTAQAEGYTTQFEEFNTKNQPFLFYNPDPEAPGPPQRGGAPQVQSALLEQIRQASGDIEATTNLFAPAMGNAPQLLSEKSVASQAAMGDRGSFEYSDNLQKSIQYTGEILIDLIPRIYDTPRIVRILDISGESKDEPINTEAIDNLNLTVTDEQTGDAVIVNDLSKGRYTVTVTSGPSFLTRRDQSAQQLIDLASASPIFESISMDLIAKNLNVLETEELTKRIRKRMIAQGIVEPTDQEIQDLGLNQPQERDPVQDATVEALVAQAQSLLADAENKQADTVNKQVKAQQDTAKTLEILVGTVIDKIKEGIPVTEQERDLLIKQRDIVASGQRQLEPGMNSEQQDAILDALLSNVATIPAQQPPILQ